MLSKTFYLCLMGATALAAASALAEDKGGSYDTSKLPPAASKTDVTYAADIQPIFEKSCYPCHSEKSKKPKGKLRVDTLEMVMKGGEDGAVVAPNDISKSPLLASVAHLGDPDDYMPPVKNKGHIQPLTAAQIGLIRAWIEQGAK